MENIGLADVPEVTVSGGDVQYITEVSVDTEQLQAEIVGVNEKLTVLILFVCAFSIWYIAKNMYRFLDSMF